MPYDEVMLIRCPPDEAGLDAVISHVRVQPGGRRLMFFHGPGLDWAESAIARQGLAAATQAATLMLCSAGWRQRGGAAVPAGWQLGSLMQFWDAADRCAEIASFGRLDGGSRDE